MNDKITIEKKDGLYFLWIPCYDEIVLDEKSFNELYRVLFDKHFEKEHAKMEVIKREQIH